MKIVLKKL